MIEDSQIIDPLKAHLGSADLKNMRASSLFFKDQISRKEILKELLKEKMVVKVAAGCGHTVFVTGEGKAFTCGDGEYGQLGLGNENHKYTPQEIKALSGHCVVGVAGGASHTVFVTDKGKVFACGSGDSGGLGFGNEVNKNTPQEVTSLPATVISSKRQQLQEQEELAQRVEGASLQSGLSVSS